MRLNFIPNHSRFAAASAIPVLSLLLLTGVAGCQAPVKPWQRQYLAQPAMQFDSADQDLVMENHFYYSKEGTSGGTGVSAGGCGCN